MVNIKTANSSSCKLLFYLKPNIFATINPTDVGQVLFCRAGAGLQNKV